MDVLLQTKMKSGQTSQKVLLLRSKRRILWRRRKKKSQQRVNIWSYPSNLYILFKAPFSTLTIYFYTSFNKTKILELYIFSHPLYNRGVIKKIKPSIHKNTCSLLLNTPNVSFQLRQRKQRYHKEQNRRKYLKKINQLINRSLKKQKVNKTQKVVPKIKNMQKKRIQTQKSKLIDQM